MSVFKVVHPKWGWFKKLTFFVPFCCSNCCWLANIRFRLILLSFNRFFVCLSISLRRFLFSETCIRKQIFTLLNHVFKIFDQMANVNEKIYVLYLERVEWCEASQFVVDPVMWYKLLQLSVSLMRILFPTFFVAECFSFFSLKTSISGINVQISLPYALIIVTKGILRVTRLKTIIWLPLFWTIVSMLAVVVVVVVNAVLLDTLLLFVFKLALLSLLTLLWTNSFSVLLSSNSMMLNKSEKLLEYLFLFKVLAPSDEEVTTKDASDGMGELDGAGGGDLFFKILTLYVPFLHLFILLARALFTWVAVMNSLFTISLLFDNGWVSLSMLLKFS